MIRFDLWILDRIYQPATDWVNDWIAQNCFSQARAAWRIALLILMLDTASYDPTWIHICLDILFMIPLTAWQCHMINEDEKQQLKKPNMMNIRRVESVNRLIIPFIFAIIDIGGVHPTILVQQAVLFSALYIGACTPRPPKPKTYSKLAMANR